MNTTESTNTNIFKMQNLREDSQIDFFTQSVLWTLGGGGVAGDALNNQ